MNKTINSWQIKTFTDMSVEESHNTNIDVEVIFASGKRYGATFFTLQNIQELMEKFATTGECKNGLYFWASYPIIVRQITDAIIKETVENLIFTGEFKHAFEEFSDD